MGDEINSTQSGYIYSSTDSYWGQNGDLNYLDPHETASVYFGKIETWGQYTKRTLVVKIAVPFEYHWNKRLSKIYKIGPPPSGYDAPTVSYIGSPGEMVNENYMSYLTADYADIWSSTLTSEGGVSLSANERRTIILTTAGNVKIISGWHAASLSYGSVIDGVTVQEAQDETGFHSGTAEISVSIPIGTASQPTFQYHSTINMTFYGVARD